MNCKSYDKQHILSWDSCQILWETGLYETGRWVCMRRGKWKRVIQIAPSAYGPQLRDTPEKKSSFWKFLDKVADSAWEEGKGFYLQGDLNSWLGYDVINGDPHKQNENGKLFSTFLQRHPQLIVANALPICKGIITRKRNLITGKI